MRNSDVIVFVNESIRSEYQRRYRVNGQVVRNCASLVNMEVGLSLHGIAGVPQPSALVLYQGGFTEGRGLDVVISALVDFPKDAHLVLMGYGPMRETLLSLAAAVGVADRVSVVDAVPPNQLIATTASATVGLIPYQPLSLNNKLSLPNKIFEYTSAGLPIVAAAIPEVSRVVESGVGLTYDPFDAKDLARAVTAILQPSALESCRKASQRWGRENSWDRERMRLIEAWGSALTGTNFAAGSNTAEPLGMRGGGVLDSTVTS